MARKQLSANETVDDKVMSAAAERVVTMILIEVFIAVPPEIRLTTLDPRRVPKEPSEIECMQISDIKRKKWTAGVWRGGVDGGRAQKVNIPVINEGKGEGGVQGLDRVRVSCRCRG
ncbi:MAG: hypothetical protein Fur0034_01850 [Desulfuromonadia bacterium]